MSTSPHFARTPPADPIRTLLAPAGTRVYAVGDIHGRKDLLDRLLAMILRDSQRSRAGRRLIVFLGDYVDRGPQSKAVVETLLAGPPPVPHWAGFRWLCLKGNHEHAMLRFLDDLSIGRAWLANGGLATIEDYAGEDRLDEADLAELQALLRRHLPEGHATFLAGLPLSHVEGDYLFVHAGIRPGVPWDLQQPNDLMWIRSEFLSSSADHGKMVVHGHSIVKAPESRRNRIGIDTGAFASGHLTALVLEGAERRFLTT